MKLKDWIVAFAESEFIFFLENGFKVWESKTVIGKCLFPYLIIGLCLATFELINWEGLYVPDLIKQM